MMKVMTVALGIALGLSSCAKKQEAKKLEAKKELTTAVEILKVKKTTYEEHRTYFGNARAKAQVTLRAYGGGQVTELKVEPGMMVKKNQSLCKIDSEKHEIALKSAKLAEGIAHDNFQRAKKHLKSGQTSRLNVKKFELDYHVQMSSRINGEKLYNGALCLSPFDGIVLSRHVNLYDELNPNAPTYEIAALDRIIIEFNIPSSEIYGFKVGNTARIKFKSINDDSFVSKIETLALSVNSKDQTYQATVALNNFGHKIKPGMMAELKVERLKLKERIVIPTDAILTHKDKQIVMVETGERAEMRTVKVSQNNSHFSLISAGLKEGDHLIVGGHFRVKEGMKVKAKVRK